MIKKFSDPLWPIARIFLIFLIFLVVCIGLYKNLGYSENQSDNSQIIKTKYLYFYDSDDGAVIIRDKLGYEVSRFSEESGFARMAIRSLAQKRIEQGVGPEKPFKLISRESGRLSLFDPVTKSQIDVDAFGKANYKVFAFLLNMDTQNRK
jgi:putative photosynthetic complex assembly protein